MTELVDATIVTANGDWEGVYIDGELQYENHSASLDDVTLPDNQAVDTINHEHYNIQRIGRTSLPNNLAKLKRLTDFADTVEEHYDYWVEKIPELYDIQNKEYVMTDEADKFFGVGSDEGPVVFALFSKISVTNKQTPLGNDPIVELDHENSVSGNGPAAYKLINN